MIIYDIFLIVQYQVSTTVMDFVVGFALFVFMLELLCFSVATVFLVNKDLYIIGLVPETVLVFEPENYAVIHAPNVVVVVPNQGNTVIIHDAAWRHTWGRKQLIYS